ncbi:MAG: Asp-tRNA(Asn)/Glu-tRNA(Gln) amidotransferase subunit GatB [Saprospiraceae bacterium]|nr:Asp-tRNA(Asn)/Glu-tRNA(Gln) amidotransferase subunit GatB [Saprospiraceae bacterium]MCB9326042.1 Asp-tRNA(Asn)/Glu-tRNA(Gln) amidotransferase subunit GatB [Lewinellaceae bacterium]
MSKNHYDKYETVVGLEVHVQLATQSKAFCADDASFGGEPNTHISVISLGHPGTLPRLNKKQFEFAIRLGLALESRISPVSYFDRKNYFYADLPKGYQITQDRLPVCVGGHIDVRVGEAERRIRIHHIHMEEDAGKSIHDQDETNSLIDLNRAGVPLLEIVTEPDFRSAEEVDVFMNNMRRLVRYLEISDGNMEQGSMRCDCNVSVRLKGEETFGERCEIKNMNSMRFARRAINFEFSRQVDLIESGGKVQQQTLNFDPVTGTTSPLRDKEDAHDYRYFPEPDLPPFVASEAIIEGIKAEMPTLPEQHFVHFTETMGITAYDAGILVEEKSVALFFLELCKHTKNTKGAANLIINRINPICKDMEIDIEAFPVSLTGLAELIELIDTDKISNAMAYQRLLPEMLEKPGNTPLDLANQLGLIQTSDEGFIEKIVDEVILAFPDKVTAYQSGKKGLLGFFMGEVMKRSQGKAEPKSTNALLLEKLG